VRPVDMEPRLAAFLRDTPPELRELARDHADFLRQLCQERTLLERRYYVAVPGPERPVRVKTGEWAARGRAAWMKEV